ncbi:MAG TPA: sterol desaturase family protein [Candidatus Hydrogenedentes bacterium]|nr:sterol desaturase family protein [Candidatus Hydrogenedentota bacterium]
MSDSESLTAEMALPPYRAKVRGFYHSRWYNGYVYFGATNALALSAITGAALLRDDVQPIEWMFLAAAFLVANLAEWLAHRGPMHRRTWWIAALFDRHTLVHHVYFPHDDMAARDHREWLYVLFPAFAIGLVFATALPLALLAAFLFGRNAGCLFFIVAIGYYLLYEWFHLVYHWPESSRIGRFRIVRALRRHHLVHHHHQLMQRYNFNITFPIWDYLLGSAYRERTLP